MDQSQNGCRSVSRVELFEQLLHVQPHHVDRAIQPIGDLDVSQPATDKPYHLGLAPGQPKRGDDRSLGYLKSHRDFRTAIGAEC